MKEWGNESLLIEILKEQAELWRSATSPDSTAGLWGRSVRCPPGPARCLANCLLGPVECLRRSTFSEFGGLTTSLHFRNMHIICLLILE
jgi:hypothetical protein